MLQNDTDPARSRPENGTAGKKPDKQTDAELKRIEEERAVYARLHALTGNFIVVYVVDPETERYREFSATENYMETFAQAKEGMNFFNTVREAARSYNHPEDLDRFLSAFTKENILRKLEEDGVFTKKYRLIDTGKPMYVNLKITRMNTDGRHLIIGISTIN